MSFWQSLFGRGNGVGAAPKTLQQLEHKGYLIEAQPFLDGGQYQVAGVISKSIDGERREHRFVRADRTAGANDAAEIAINKGRQIIDQQGDKIFA